MGVWGYPRRWALTGLALWSVVLLPACSDDTSSGTPAPSTLPPPTTVAATTTSTVPPPTVPPATTSSVAPEPQPPLICVKTPVANFDAANLPDKVAETARSILAAVAACDAARITELAGPDFSYGGGRGDPVRIWALSGFELAWVPRLLATRPTLDTFRDGSKVFEEFYVWPAAATATSTASDADWKAAEALHRASDLARWRAAGSYPGPRLMIRPDGQWWGLVRGD